MLTVFFKFKPYCPLLFRIGVAPYCLSTAVVLLVPFLNSKVTFACKTELSISKDQNVLESGFASRPALCAFGLLVFRNEEKKETARSVLLLLFTGNAYLRSRRLMAWGQLNIIVYIELACTCVAIENQAYKLQGI